MPNPATTPPRDDDMPAAIDFAGAVRDKFHRPHLRVNLPVCLGADEPNHLGWQRIDGLQPRDSAQASLAVLRGLTFAQSGIDGRGAAGI